MNRFLALLAGLLLAYTALPQKTDVFLPSEMEREQIIHHKGFSLSYSSAYVLSTWVSYKVTNANVTKDDKMKGKYQPDPEISTRSATKKDYKDSGYLMAQLCNYADVSQIDGATEESFYMSNIVPMKLAYYQHIWLKTEDLIRLWLKGTDAFYIVAGVYTNEAPYPTIGENKVAIPKHFYKVVYDKVNNEAIAFKFKNGMSSGSLKSYTLSIDKLEEETNIDFFPELDDAIESKIEATVNYNFWNFELEDDL
jgi:endonuclease G, mitochondrial